MGEVTKKASRLQRRIAAGKADTISDRERVQFQELRHAYIRRFGKDPDGRPVAKTA